MKAPAESHDVCLGRGAEVGEDFFSGRCGFQLLAVVLVAQEPRHGRQKEQVFLELTLRRQKQQAQRHRLVVERLKIDAGTHSAECRDDVLDARDAGMGKGDAVADPGALARFAVLDGFAHRLAVFRADLVGPHQHVNELVNHGPAVRSSQARDHLLHTQDFRQIHVSYREPRQ